MHLVPHQACSTVQHGGPNPHNCKLRSTPIKPSHSSLIPSASLRIQSWYPPVQSLPPQPGARNHSSSSPALPPISRLGASQPFLSASLVTRRTIRSQIQLPCLRQFDNIIDAQLRSTVLVPLVSHQVTVRMVDSFVGTFLVTLAETGSPSKQAL